MKNKLFFTSFLVMLMILSGVYVYNYCNNILGEKVNSARYQYLALNSTETLESITLKKELIDPKEYYKSGDDIKYNIIITNNNTESVILNLEDNYNNVENTQRNIVIESVSCNNSTITPSSNKVVVKNITLASKESYTCTVDAYAKKTYIEGKVNSRAKVYIDDEDEYKESEFTYLVRDTDFDIQIDTVDSFMKSEEEIITYNFRIKNLNAEKKSGKVELKLYLSGTNLIMVEPHANNYNHTFSGASKDLITSKVKFECLTSDGTEACLPNKSQMLKFTVNGLNPNETFDIKVNFKLSIDISDVISTELTPVVYAYNEDNSNWIKYYKKEHRLRFVPASKHGRYGELYTVNSDGNIIYDLHDIDLKDAKAQLYLHYNFRRTSTSDPLENMRIVQDLPSNVLYDSNKQTQKNNCSPYNFSTSKTSSGLISLDTKCGLDESNYLATVDVPINITKSMLNKKICLDVDTLNTGSTIYTNKYCLGPDLDLDSITATQDNNKVVTVKFAIRNKYNGYAKDAKITMTYDTGMTVNNNSLENATNNTSNRLITWTLPYIAPYKVNTVTLKLNNPSDLATLNTTLNIEGKSVTKSISISKPTGEDVTQKNVRGDWNQDGNVTITDLLYARQYIAQVKELKLPLGEIYDFNNDQKPGVGDIIGLRQLLVNKK